MGSTTTGRFSDYPGTPEDKARAKKGKAGHEGGQPSRNQCEVPLTNVTLEEVARSSYYSSHAALPSDRSSVSVSSSLVGGRIGVVLNSSQEVIGLLPTEYNYVIRCMNQGYSYEGEVSTTTQRPIPIVRVNLRPQK